MSDLAAAPPAQPERHAWMDGARGICIVAVVTLYTTQHVQTAQGSLTWMQHWVDFAHPFRMPDFFFISGLLLGRVIDRPWRAYADKKVVHFLYFFLLWSLIYFVARFGLGRVGLTTEDLGRELFKVMVHSPFAMLWFIQMLAFYFVLTKALRRAPWPLVLPLAVLWYLLPIDTPWKQVDRAGERFVFFYAGYVFATQTFAYARWVGERRGAALAGLAVWAVLNGALVFSGAAAASRPLTLLLGFAGAFAVIAVAVLLQPLRGADWLRHCGRHSLPIYLAFFIPMSLLTTASLWAMQATGLRIDPGLLAALLAAASITTALSARRWARGTAFDFLYERPAWAHLRRPVSATAPSQA